MEQQAQQYRGHRIELRIEAEEERAAREQGREALPKLLIDSQPVRYGRLPDGSYALQEYAYDWRDNLIDLAKRFIDYKDEADGVRREAESGRQA
jgi:hypothetical protein